ncbi:MAG: RNA polymerase sigma factor [Bacteroidota bacterium]|jgi:RNA polymerase sigma factor (sigma-70 family)
MINQQEDKDYQLLRDSLGGNALAQKDFFVRFSKTVYAVCLRYMNNEDDAKDMLQECLIKVFQKGGEFRFEGSLEGWIRRISVNTCLDHIKKRRLTFTDDIANLEIPVEKEWGYNSLEYNDLLKLLYQLPVGYRLVFNLYAMEGFTHAEIADMLQISENTSKSQLFKARQWLKSKITRN